MHFSINSVVFASCICNLGNRLLVLVDWLENSFKPKSGHIVYICIPSLPHCFTDLRDSSRTPSTCVDLSFDPKNLPKVDRQKDEKMDWLTFYYFKKRCMDLYL